MSNKFKVKDVVKVVADNGGGHEFFVDDIVTITDRNSNDTLFRCSNGFTDYWLTPAEIAPWQSPLTRAIPVSIDKPLEVLCIDTHTPRIDGRDRILGGLTKGEIYTVVADSGYFYSIINDEGKTCRYMKIRFDKALQSKTVCTSIPYQLGKTLSQHIKV